MIFTDSLDRDSIDFHAQSGCQFVKCMLMGWARLALGLLCIHPQLFQDKSQGVVKATVFIFIFYFCQFSRELGVRKKEKLAIACAIPGKMLKCKK